jgi:mRNA interferase RelE/StbE
MGWRVEFTDVALKSLKKLDKKIAAIIISYIEKNLTGQINPRATGRPLAGNNKGKWRYRIGSFRLLCKIEDYRVTIVVVQIGDRKDIYQ